MVRRGLRRLPRGCGDAGPLRPCAVSTGTDHGPEHFPEKWHRLSVENAIKVKKKRFPFQSDREAF